jgi:hypothetical protein
VKEGSVQYRKHPHQTWEDIDIRLSTTANTTDGINITILHMTNPTTQQIMGDWAREKRSTQSSTSNWANKQSPIP